MSKFLSPKNPVGEELALMALAASPTPEDAVVFLKAEHDIITTVDKLRVMARYNAEQYEDLRDRIAPLKERTLTHNLKDNALYASELTKVSMEQLQRRLEEGKIPAEYLSRVARDIADVESKSIEKALALEGRPTAIVENRSASEIVKKLESMGVFKDPPDAEVVERATITEG